MGLSLEVYRGSVTRPKARELRSLQGAAPASGLPRSSALAYAAGFLLHQAASPVVTAIPHIHDLWVEMRLSSQGETSTNRFLKPLSAFSAREMSFEHRLATLDLRAFSRAVVEMLNAPPRSPATEWEFAQAARALLALSSHQPLLTSIAPRLHENWRAAREQVIRPLRGENGVVQPMPFENLGSRELNQLFQNARCDLLGVARAALEGAVA